MTRWHSNIQCENCGCFVPDGEAECVDGCPQAPKQRQHVSREQLIEDLEEVEQIVDGRPTISDYAEHGKHSRKTIYRKFGSWDDALNKIGYQKKTYNIAEDDILADIVRVAEELGRTPTMSEYDENGVYSRSTPRDRFGTWNQAIELAGLEPNEQGGYRPPIAKMSPEDVGLSPVGSRTGGGEP